MSIGQVLSMGRKIGYENVVQIQNLRRVAKSDRGQVATTLVLPSDARYDQFIMSKTGLAAETDDASYNIVKKFFPKSLSDKALTSIDVLLKKFSKDSGVFSMDISTRASGELLNGSTLKVARNNSATKVKAEGFSLENGTFMDAKVVFPNKGVKMPEVDEIINKLDYKEELGMSKLGFDYKDDKGLTSVSVKYETPKELVDSLVQAGTGGQFKSMQEIVDNAKFLHSPAASTIEEAEFNRIMAQHPEFDLPSPKDLPEGFVSFN